MKIDTLYILVSSKISTDIALLGEIYLDGIDGKRNDIFVTALKEMLPHYVEADVELLFELADARPFE